MNAPLTEKCIFCEYGKQSSSLRDFLVAFIICFQLLFSPDESLPVESQFMVMWQLLMYQVQSGVKTVFSWVLLLRKE